MQINKINKFVSQPKKDLSQYYSAYLLRFTQKPDNRFLSSKQSGATQNKNNNTYAS